MADAIARSVLWVERAILAEDCDYLEDAPPVEERPPTWREEHPLDGGRVLALPGGRLHDRTLSFWQESPDPEERPSVVSLTIDRDGLISGLAWWRRKKCVPTPQASGKCKRRA